VSCQHAGGRFRKACWCRRFTIIRGWFSDPTAAGRPSRSTVGNVPIRTIGLGSVRTFARGALRPDGRASRCEKGKPVRPIFSRANGLFGDARRWPHRREPIAYVLISCVLPDVQACFVQACLAPSGPVRPPRPVEMS
jgi:hypothetical protein